MYELLKRYFEKVTIFYALKKHQFFLIFFLAFLVIFFESFFNVAKCDEDDNLSIWQPKNIKIDDIIILGDEERSNPKVQKRIDASVKKTFEYELVYTNLAQCLEIALENNYDIHIQRQYKESSKWEYRAKFAELLPNFYYDFMISRIDGEYLVGNVLPVRIHEIPIEQHFTFRWDTFNQGRVIWQIKSKKNDYQAEMNRLNFSVEETMLNVSLAYYDLLQSKLDIEVMKVNLYETTHQLNYTKALYELGQGTKYDVLRAEVEVAQANQQLAETLKSLRTKQARLANLMGIDVLTSIYPSEIFINTVDTYKKDEKYNVETLCKKAHCLREDLRAKKALIKSLENQKKTVYADFLPNLILQYDKAFVGTARLGLRGNDTLYLNARWNLGKHLGVNSIAMIKSYDAKIKAAKFELEKLQREIEESVVSSYYESDANLKKVQYGKKEIEAADEGVKNAMARMSIGEATFLDVLNSQKDKTEARSSLIRYIIQYNKNQVQLLFDTGEITTEKILSNYIIPPENIFP